MSDNVIGIESSVLRSILLGEKTAEGRLGKDRFRNIKIGDTLTLREDVWEKGKIVRSIPDRGSVTVTQLLHFETFEEMLCSLDLDAVLPGAESIEAALRTYGQFYAKEDEDRYGVVAIMFELS